MSKYIVKDVVCDTGIYLIDNEGAEELIEICNSKRNAELICEILNADLLKNGTYTIWKDAKIADLEVKLAEKEKSFNWIYSKWQKCVENQTKSKTEFAIERLNDIKNKLKDKRCLMENNEHCYPQNTIRWNDAMDIINQTIKELKGESYGHK